MKLLPNACNYFKDFRLTIVSGKFVSLLLYILSYSNCEIKCIFDGKATSSLFQAISYFKRLRLHKVFGKDFNLLL